MSFNSRLVRLKVAFFEVLFEVFPSGFNSRLVRLKVVRHGGLSIAARCIPPEDRMDVYHFNDSGAPEK